MKSLAWQHYVKGTWGTVPLDMCSLVPPGGFCCSQLLKQCIVPGAIVRYHVFLRFANLGCRPGGPLPSVYLSRRPRIFRKLEWQNR